MPLNSNIRPKVEGQRFPQVGGTCFLKSKLEIFTEYKIVFIVGRRVAGRLLFPV